MLFVTLRCSYAGCFGPTPFAGRACGFLRFRQMPFKTRRSSSHSVIVAIAVTLMESSGGKMAVMSSANETALAPSTSKFVLNSFSTLDESEL